MVCIFLVHWRILTWSADAYLVSGHYSRTIVAHFGRRPWSAGKGQLLAHVPELYHTTQGVDGKAAQLEMYRPSSRASNRSHTEGTCVVWGGVYRWEERVQIQVQPRRRLKIHPFKAAGRKYTLP